MHIDESELENFMIDSGVVSEKDIALSKAEAKEKNTSIGKLLVAETALIVLARGARVLLAAPTKTPVVLRWPEV